MIAAAEGFWSENVTDTNFDARQSGMDFSEGRQD